MQKNALTVTAGVLLVIYSLLNFGAAIGQFTKGDMMGGLSSMVVGTSEGVASLHDKTGDAGMQRQGNQLRAQAADLESSMASEGTLLYAIAVFILVVAITGIVAAIGTFTGQNWAFMALVLAGCGGILVEIQDVVEDGMGIGKILFFLVNGLVLFTAFSAREPAAQAADH